MSATTDLRSGSTETPDGVGSAPRGPLGKLPPEARRWIASALAAAVGIAVLWGVLSWVARRAVLSRAEAAGFDVTVKEVDVRLGSVVLRDVVAKPRGISFVSIALDRVEVSLALDASPRRVEAHGGRVRLEGSRDELARRFDELRARGEKKTSGEPSHRTPIAADGIDVVWAHAFAGAGNEYVWGARYEREDGGKERLSADLVRLDLGTSRVEVEQGGLALDRIGGRRTIRALSAGRVACVLDLDREAPPSAEAHGASAPGMPPTGPSDRFEALRDRLTRMTEIVSGAVSDPGKLEVRGAGFEIRHAGQALNIGPATLVLSREKSRVAFSVTSGSADGATPLKLELVLPVGAGPVDVALSGGPVSLAALGIRENDMGLLGVNRSEVEVSGRARLSGDAKAVSVQGHSRWTGLSVFHPKLAPEPVRGLDLAVSGEADVQLDGSHAVLRDVELAVGKVRLRTRGSIDRGEGHARGALHAEVPLAACGDVIASIPSALAPLFTGVRVGGTFALSLDVEFDTRRPGDTRVSWNAENDCRVTEVPAALAPDRFTKPWVRTVLAADGLPTTIESGPGTPTWTPLTDISPYVQTAVVVCEDSRFFTHHGFDPKSISDSLRDNLRAGRFVRGASTVSMQLAKNLYLGREKTLSRKLQEAFLTLLLEQVFSKEQLLELYLNVIEFAPGVYGIEPAAAHYFKSTARDLSLAQSLYLVSLLPNPKNHHFEKDGALRPAWAEYLRKLMHIARAIRRIDERELEAGLAESVQFGVPSALPAEGEGNRDEAPETDADAVPEP